MTATRDTQVRCKGDMIYSVEIVFVWILREIDVGLVIICAAKLADFWLGVYMQFSTSLSGVPHMSTKVFIGNKSRSKSIHSS